jgi:DNA uptake protein ComE-like DNA-binding protein
MKQGREQGFVLVVVMWVLVILTIITVGFGRRSLIDQQIAAYSLDHAQALMMARGAVERGIVDLRNKAVQDLAFAQAATLESTPDGAGGMGRPPITHLGQAWAQPRDILKDDGFFDREKLGEADTASYFIRDELSLININTAPAELLHSVKGLNTGAVREIRARLSGGLEGREKEGRLAFHAIEELRYIDDIDDEDWLGTDEVPGLRDIMTTAGSGTINLNTASREVLLCIPKVNERMVNTIIAFRAGGDGEIGTADDQGINDFDHLRQVVGSEKAEDIQPFQQFGAFNSNTFTVTGIATRRNGRVRAAVTATITVGTQLASVLNWREEPLGS